MALASERELELKAVEDRNLRVKLGLKRINFSSLFSGIFFLISYFLPRVVATRIITIYFYIAGTQVQSMTDQLIYTITRRLKDLNYPGLEFAILISFILMTIAAFLEPIVYIVKGPLRSKMPTGLNIKRTRYIMIGIAVVVNIISAYYLLTFKSRVHAHYDTFYNTLITSRENYLIQQYGEAAAYIIIHASSELTNYTVISMTVGYFLAVIARYLALFAILAILGAIGKEIEI